MPQRGEVWRFAALRRVGLRSPDDVVEWATNQLALGRDTPALVELACMSRGVSERDVDPLLDELMTEVGLPAMSTREAVMTVAVGTAADVVAGRLDLIPGARRISRLHVDADADELLGIWVLLSEWEDNLGLREAYAADLRRGIEELARLDVLPR